MITKESIEAAKQKLEERRQKFVDENFEEQKKDYIARKDIDPESYNLFCVWEERIGKGLATKEEGIFNFWRRNNPLLFSTEQEDINRLTKALEKLAVDRFATKKKGK